MKKYILFITFLMSFTLVFTGCKKYLDVNKNENDPTAVPLSTLLPAAQVSLANSLAMGYGFSNVLAVYTHQMTTRESPDQYGILPSEFYINQGWSEIYENALADLDVIIAQGGADNETRRDVYVGMAKVLKAYGFSQLVDVFGDVPFSEFNKFNEGVRTPKFDAGAEIYPALITMLDEAVVSLNGTQNASIPGADDLIYKGDKAKWIKAANTLKLKLYTQIRKVSNVQSQIQALLSSPSTLINTTAESFLMPFGPLGATDDRNPGFDDYVATQRSNHVSPWLYEIMKGYNPRINTGIEDPRIPYYIYNQIKPTAASQSNTEYRDGSFISIYFGSKGPFRDGNQQNSISLFGIYPVGGRYDDGNGGTASASSGTGAAPYRFITYADRLYLEAELIDAGLVTGNKRDVFEKAMKASMEQVDYVITSFIKPTQTVPALYNTAAANNYIFSVLTKYDASDNARKTEYIMTQKWLSSIGSAVDQYTDYRRTGYPTLFDPENAAMAPGGFVQPPVDGNQTIEGDQPKVEVSTDVPPYPVSIYWPQSELNLNKNAPQQKTQATFKVFWQP